MEGRILDGDVLGRGMFGGAGGWYGGADKVGEVYMFVALQVIFDIDRIIFLFCNFAGWRGHGAGVSQQRQRRQ